MAALLADLAPVAPRALPLAAALGRVAVGIEAGALVPEYALARLEGWAVSALDLVGASAQAPVLLMPQPQSCAVGDRLPAGCNAILPFYALVRQGPMALALAEVRPGEGVLRAGGWLRVEQSLIAAGTQLGTADLLLAEMAGLRDLGCRVPKILCIEAVEGSAVATIFLRPWLAAQGADCEVVPLAALAEQDMGEFARAQGADAVLWLGASPQGAALQWLAQGLGFAGLEAVALGVIRQPEQAIPLLVLPDMAEAAITAAFAVLDPLLRQLSGAQPAPVLRRPLLGKIASAVGLAELVLLRLEEDGWHPLPRADFGVDPQQLRQADGFCVIASGDEGWPEGADLTVTRMMRGSW